MTRGSVLARLGRALVDVDLAVVAAEAIHAQAFEAVRFVETSASVQAGLFGAVVNVDQAVAAFESVAAFTRVAARGVDALASIATGRVHGALVNVLVAEAADKAEWTSADVVLEIGRGGAGRSVGAVVSLARVHFHFARFPRVRRFTDANEVVDVVNAGPVVLAGPEQAVVDVLLAVPALESRLALAGVGVEVRLTFAAMLARIGLAQVHFCLAAPAFVALFALADELVEAVLTSAAI